MNAYKKERKKERKNGVRRGCKKEGGIGRRAGTTLIEVLVALFIIGLASTGSVYCVYLGMNSVLSAKERIVAQNLAREGIEAVQTAVSTNLIRFDDEKCWNFDIKWMLPCGTGKSLDGSYRLKFDIKYGQFEQELESVSGELVKKEGEKEILNPMYLLSFKKQEDETYMTFDDNSAPADKTKFHRAIKIQNIDENTMRVSSKIGWVKSGNIKIFELTKIIEKP